MNSRDKKTNKQEITKDKTTKKIMELDQKLKKQKKAFETFLRKIEDEKQQKHHK